MRHGRYPDFLIIGTMKSGTTSLFRWLGSHPEVGLPGMKEPHFFSWDARWSRGIDWYRSLFGEIPEGLFTGEASTSYTLPRFAAIAADRIGSTVPDAKLVAVLRDPLQRLRSHYRHEVLRARERRSFVEAIQEPDNDYVGASLYDRCLAPYSAQWQAGRLLVVRLDDMKTGGWDAILKYLGLADHPIPTDRHNLSAEKQPFTPALKWMWERGWDRYFKLVPAPIRNIGRRHLLERDPRLRSYLDQAEAAPIPDTVLQTVSEDASRLSVRFGVEPWALQVQPPG